MGVAGRFRVSRTLLEVHMDVATATRGLRAAAAFVALLLVLPLASGCKAVFPSNNRVWAEDHAVLACPHLDGDLVTIHNIRNFRWADSTQHTTAYYDKTLDLREVRTVDYFICYPSAKRSGFAHTFLSFGFGDSGYYLPISVEARRELGEEYNPIRGMLRQYELIYVIADERDIIDLRVNGRGEQLYCYPIQISQPKVRALLEDMLTRASCLVECPKFYRTLRGNCTTTLAEHARDVAGRRLVSNYQILLPGYSDELLYKLQLIETDMPFEAVRSRALINERAHDHRDSDDFSARFRQRS